MTTTAAAITAAMMMMLGLYEEVWSPAAEMEVDSKGKSGGGGGGGGGDCILFGVLIFWNVWERWGFYCSGSLNGGLPFSCFVFISVPYISVFWM